MLTESHTLLTVSNVTKRQRRLSREEIINKMENEQDAIVIKLLREIEELKNENMRLKSTINKIMYNNNNNHISSSSNANTNSECAIATDDEDEDEGLLKNIHLSTISNNNHIRIPNSPSHSRRSSSSTNNYSTIFPIEFKSLSSTNNNNNNNINISNPTTNKRRLSSSSALNIHNYTTNIHPTTNHHNRTRSNSFNNTNNKTKNTTSRLTPTVRR